MFNCYRTKRIISNCCLCRFDVECKRIAYLWTMENVCFKFRSCDHNSTIIFSQFWMACETTYTMSDKCDKLFQAQTTKFQNFKTCLISLFLSFLTKKNCESRHYYVSKESIQCRQENTEFEQLNQWLTDDCKMEWPHCDKLYVFVYWSFNWGSSIEKKHCFDLTSIVEI